MQVHQFNQLEAARRAANFLAATPVPPPLATMPASFHQQVQVLTTTIQEIDTQTTSQLSAAGAIHDCVSGAREAAQELRSFHLVPLKRVAGMLVRGRTGDALSPNFAASISIPHIRSYSALLAAAAATVQIVTPHAALFIARGLPDDFLDQLTAQAATLSEAMGSSGVAKRTRASSTADLKRLFQELRDTLHILEFALTKACRADRLNGPATMAAWKTARAIRKTATPTEIPFAQSPLVRPALAPTGSAAVSLAA